MSRQHTNPYSIVGDKVFQLQRISDVFDEDWLQRFIFEHHQTIPLGEIEPAFGPLIPVCRELPTKAGPIDLVFINPTGLLTLVECKLWKNPEARREVVGQILDYAKELSRWTYDDLQTAVGQAQSASEASLHRLILANSEYIDERDFVDGVACNLRRGRFLLLIIGDGIRENVEQIATFMDKHAHLNFGYALIEYGVFQMPSTGEPSYFIQPRVIAQTIEARKGSIQNRRRPDRVGSANRRQGRDAGEKIKGERAGLLRTSKRRFASEDPTPGAFQEGRAHGYHHRIRSEFDAVEIARV